MCLELVRGQRNIYVPVFDPVRARARDPRPCIAPVPWAGGEGEQRENGAQTVDTGPPASPSRRRADARNADGQRCRSCGQ